jgi:hypothetical protein
MIMRRFAEALDFSGITGCVAAIAPGSIDFAA